MIPGRRWGSLILWLCSTKVLQHNWLLDALQGYFGSGYFTEGNASADNNYLKRIESKKLLSNIEKSGLLSKAEKAGLTLSRIEQAKLLSTAENLGLLTVLERLLVTDPGRVTALSIPFFLAAVGEPSC